MSGSVLRSSDHETWSVETSVTLPAARRRHSALDLGARPDRRVDLGLAAEARDVMLFVERQIMDAGFDGRGVAFGAVARGELVAASDRAMHDMRRAAGRRAGLVDLGHGEQFRDRRPRQAMRAPVGDSGRLHLLQIGVDRLVVLVVHAGRKPGRGDRGEDGVKQMRRDARKAFGIGSEGRELERRRRRPRPVRRCGRDRLPDRSCRRARNRPAPGRLRARLCGAPLLRRQTSAPSS